VLARWENFFTDAAPRPPAYLHFTSGGHSQWGALPSECLAQEDIMLFAKKAKWAAKSSLYRKWLAEKFIHDIPRVAKDKWDDFDADDVLRYIGLTTAKPVKRTLGGLGAFVIGAAVGSIVALMLAPTPGVELRTQVKDKAMGYLNKQNINLGQEKTASA
jgi:hypothetical protein